MFFAGPIKQPLFKNSNHGSAEVEIYSEGIENALMLFEQHYWLNSSSFDRTSLYNSHAELSRREI